MPTSQPLRSTLARHHGRVRRALLLRHTLRAAAGGALLVALAVLLGMVLPLVPVTAALRLALVVTGGLAFAAAAAIAFRRAAPGFDRYLEGIEQRFPELRSWLRNALDFEHRLPAHGSAELAQAVAEQTAARFEGVKVETLTPRVEPRGPAFAMAGAMLAIVLLGVASPGRVSHSWHTLWNPAIAAPPVRLAVEPGSVKVTPGAALAVRARVWGTGQRPHIERTGEREVRATLEGIDAEGARAWRFDLSQLTRAQRYRVKVAATASPEYRISLAGEPEALSFTFEYVAPAYARLPDQRGASTRGDVTALRGSRATVEATFDRDLESLDATLPGGATRAWTAITPRRWRGVVPVDTEGEYALHARAAAGTADFRYRVTPIGDAPPLLTVITPETDLDLPAGQQVPLEIVGQDDLGLSELRLQFRKGPATDWTSRTLARFDGEPREAHVATRWDASTLALLPGETATFRFEMFDGNTVGGRGRTVSPAFELRFPSMTDLYEQIDRSQQGVQQALEKVSERARELQKSLDHLARQQPQQQQPQRASAQNTPNFERAEEMKRTLEQQQELTQQIDQAARDLKQSLEHSAERQAFNEELQRKMRELSELMQQIQSEELRDAMRKMQQALEQMDQQQMERNLAKLQEQNKEMLEQLDRSIELLKQLREEEQMQALAKRAEELKRQQDALNEAHENPDAAKQADAKDAESKQGESKDAASEQQKNLAERQENAAKQTDQLAEDVKEMQENLAREDERAAMEKAAEELEQQAAAEQRQAARQAQQNQPRKAGQSGRKASESLDSAARQLQQMAQQRQEEREGVDLAAVRRAAKDLVSLQRSAEENMTSAPDAPERADRQTDLSEGVARVADSLYTLAQRSPFITPSLAQSLGRAMENLSTSGRELASGNRRRGENSGREAAESLNEAILELRKSEQAMCDKEGSSGGQKSSSTAQRLGEMGEQQSQVNRETRSLAQRLSEQMRLSAGDRSEMQRLAEQQQRIREQIEQIQKDDLQEQKLLGRLDDAQKEMKEVEETIREGADMSGLPEKQQRILSRLLDAQRSVHRRDFDPQRESRTAEEVPSVSAPELSPEVLRQSDRLRLDLLKAESDRYPAQYRTFIEAYLRSLNGARK